MAKTHIEYSGIERETVEHYLARGGRITRVAASLPNDLIRLSEGQLVDRMLGASYDTLFGSTPTNFDVSSDTFASIRESFDYDTMESEYAE